MLPPLLVPSILAGDHARLADSAALVARLALPWIHLDIMDGHFVPNLTFGPGTVAALRQSSRLFFEVHLMLDEPDRSLSIPNTVGLWCGFLPRLAKTCQVVVASHSPFALDVPGANVIEMHEGYLDMCRKAMEKARGKCEPK